MPVDWGSVGQWAGASATFLAVLVALKLHLRIFPPKLRLSLGSPDGDPETVAITKKEDGVVVKTSERKARYYRLRLTNDRPLFVASEVDVYLVSVETADAADRYVEVWTGALPMMATHYGIHPSRTLGADPREYDLCMLVQDKWMELTPRIMPNTFPQRYRMNEGKVKMQVTLQARALETVSPRFSFELAWDGQWSDDVAKMRLHMAVRSVTTKP